MDLLQRVAFSILGVLFKLSSFSLTLTLKAVESLCYKSQAWLSGDENQKFNFGLSFANGQKEEVEVNSEEPKRVKLLLDIHLLPDEKYKIVSATNVNQSGRQWFPVSFKTYIDSSVKSVLQWIRIFQQVIRETERYLECGARESAVACNGSHDDNDDRKKISPRKRVSKARSRNFKRYVNNIKKIMGFKKPDAIIFDPIEGVADVSLNGSFNNSKLKATEKRKHSANSTSSCDTSDDECENQLHDSNVESQGTANGLEKHEQSVEVSSTDATSTANESALLGVDEEDEDTATEETGEQVKKNYFEVDEKYDSAEDPDFVPAPHESTSDSSESADDEPQEKLIEELEDLKTDLNGGIH